MMTRKLNAHARSCELRDMTDPDYLEEFPDSSLSTDSLALKDIIETIIAKHSKFSNANVAAIKTHCIKAARNAGKLLIRTGRCYRFEPNVVYPYVMARLESKCFEGVVNEKYLKISDKYQMIFEEYQRISDKYHFVMSRIPDTLKKEIMESYSCSNTKEYFTKEEGLKQAKRLRTDLDDQCNPMDIEPFSAGEEFEGYHLSYCATLT